MKTEPQSGSESTERPDLVGPPMRAPQPGDRIGRYFVIDTLGRGAMGLVVRGFDPDLERQVAIKLMHPGHVDERRGEASRGRLVAEARALARISHPNVVAVHEVGVHEGVVFVVMELVDGVDLHEWLRVAPRSWRAVVDAFAAAGRGLVEIHAAGLIHRDVKPANILVGKNGRVCVGDLGLARATIRGPRPPVDGLDAAVESADDTALTQEGMVVGTPAYMAPEQHRGLDIGPAADQYAFCVALFEALYGERPFRVPTSAMLHAKLHPPTEPPRRDVPRRLFAIVARGLSPDPQARFGSMAQLCAALSTDPSARRRRWLAAAAAVAVTSSAIAWGLARPTPCRDAESHLVGTWDADVRHRAEQAFAASDRPWATQTWDAVAPRLDAYSQQWTQMHRDACEATHLRGEQSPAMLDRRMACLEHRRRHLAATTELLVAPDRETIDHALRLLSGLPAIAPCGDTIALAAAIAPPDDPDTAREVDRVRNQLARVRALIEAGRIRDAVELAHVVRADADASTYRPVAAEALATEGDALERIGRVSDARAALEQATWIAVGEGHDDAAVSAATVLVWIAGQRDRALPEAERWAELVRATMQRGKIDDAKRTARLELALGASYDNAARWDDALSTYASAMSRVADDGTAVLLAGTIRADIGNVWLHRGDYAQARAIFEPLAAELEVLVGRDHPDVAQIRGSLALLLDNAGEHERALQMHREIVDSLRIAFDGQGIALATALVNLANSLHRVGSIDESAEVTREALGLFERAGDLVSAAICLANLGEVYGELGIDDAAEASLERAVALVDRVRGEDHPDVVTPLVGLGHIRRTQRRFDDAAALFERAERIVRERVGPWNRERAIALEGTVLVQLDRGELEPALAASEVAIDVLRRAGDVRPGDLELALVTRASVLDGLQRFDDALAQANEALQMLAQSRDLDGAIASAQLQRGRALAGLHRRGEARAAFLSAKAAAERGGAESATVKLDAGAELDALGPGRSRLREP